MSWDLALLSPAPHDDVVEENERDRDAKTRGSGRSPLSTPSTTRKYGVLGISTGIERDAKVANCIRPPPGSFRQ